MACYYYVPFQGHCTFRRPTVSFSHNVNLPKKTDNLSPSFKRTATCFGFGVLKTAVKNLSVKLLDAFVDSSFEFVDCSSDTDQTNTAPANELREAAVVTNIHGDIPTGFPEGVYIRNGPNPTYGGLKSTESIFGKSSPIWLEGEGMLHALYFSKDTNGRWTVIYNNRYVETDKFKLEKLRNKPSFLPAVQGDALAVFSSHLPNLIDIFTLETLGDWDVNVAWNRPFTSHPKRAPGTGELVTMGIAATKPFVELGVISADGKRLLTSWILKLDRCHFAMNSELQRFSLWFKVKPNCTFHIINCFEDDDESSCTVIPGPHQVQSNLSGFQQSLSLEADHFPMEFPMINEAFVGVKNKYCYTQVCNCDPNSASGMGRFAGLAKLNFGEQNTRISLAGNSRRINQSRISHVEKNTYCSGAAFVPKEGGVEEDDGWIITFIHHQDTNVSQAYIIDAKNSSMSQLLNYTTMQSPGWFSWSFHANPTAKQNHKNDS
ncbi:hypothetical protein F3Y22_tig00001825pilonHSYRG00195 [Hibiscus syriacus]|uniref:Uncharacterized protein n=1 Tax=Hibiscus syriacus TaxID=106335 RepID=A0A6A3CVW1_HIBSY|nr:hypothetical protein F3Y22_tig00001825pilonHSYRG00195 [Hibiscus syriacus]